MFLSFDRLNKVDTNELFDLDDLTCDLRADLAVDYSSSLAQAQRLACVAESLRKTNIRSVKLNSIVHFEVGRGVEDQRDVERRVKSLC